MSASNHSGHSGNPGRPGATWPDILPQEAIMTDYDRQPAGVGMPEEPEAYVTKDLSTIRELLHPSRIPGLGMSLAEAVVEESASTARHLHKDFDEIYYCLEGAGTLFIDDAPHDFFPGMYYLLPCGVSHWLKAVARLRLLCFCVPGYTHDKTVVCE